MTAATVLLVALGAALGAAVRYLAGLGFDRAFPWGTLGANLIGSFVLGAVVSSAGSHLAALVGTGFCGGLTTYSTFAVQTVQLDRRTGTAYAVFTVLGCIAAAWLGLQV